MKYLIKLLKMKKKSSSKFSRYETTKNSNSRKITLTDVNVLEDDEVLDQIDLETQFTKGRGTVKRI